MKKGGTKEIIESGAVRRKQRKRRTPANLKPPRDYSVGEEIANSITHGLGALLSAVGLVILIILAAWRGDAWKMVSFIIYGFSLIVLYLSSTFYHSFRSPRLKKIFRVFDHSAIYVLIAGTYTPFLLIILRNTLGWTLFAILWGLALGGIVFKLFFIQKFRILSTVIYLFMGWLGVVAFKQLLASLPTTAIGLLVAGGLSYTVGVIFYAWKKLPYGHAVWHLFVMAGSLFHYLAVLWFLVPYPST